MLTQTVSTNIHEVDNGERIGTCPMARSGLCAKSLKNGRILTLLELEQEYVQKVLIHVAGNKTRAAEVLGIGRASLWRKLKKINAFTASAPSLLRQDSNRS